MSSHASRHRLAIVIFSPYLAPHVGGVESFVAELNEVLLRRTEIERITVLTSELPPGAPRREAPADRYVVVRYPAFELIPNFPVPKLWSRSFWRALRAAAPRSHDVVVSHTRFFVSSGVALVCARLAGRPLVHVEHGSDYVQLAGRVSATSGRFYDLTIGRLVLRGADAVVTVSQAAAGFVRALAGRESQVIYRGFWPHRLASLAPDPRVVAFARGRTVVAFVGRLIDGKGVPDLVRAFALLDVPGRADVPGGAVLCLVGDGPRRSDLELLANELGIGDRVRFLGYLDEAEALAAILAADVIVNPSYTEGLPTAVLEAAFLGRAVLASDVGGTREIIVSERTGVLVTPRDIESLAYELARLLADPELRERLGAAAQRDVTHRFDWETSASQFSDVARRVIDALSSPAGTSRHSARRRRLAARTRARWATGSRRSGSGTPADSDR